MTPVGSKAVRALDVVGAGTALIVLAPLMIVVSMLIMFTDPGPLIYRQQRVGRHGTTFHILKFRTMVRNADRLIVDLLASDPAFRKEFSQHQKLRRDPRISRIGRVLRPSGLDELPQLVNILRGDMSLVGPRPVQPAELERYHGAAHEVLSVRPGLTGPWQIGGRNDTSYDQRVAIDLEYVRTRTIWGDLALIMKTASKFTSGRLSGGY